MSTTTREQTADGPEIFGPYEVYERLGIGGMATVHRAKERGIEDFERIVALKRLLPHLAEDASFVRSFVREAKLASMLQHANIVQLYELGRVGEVLFISMELIEGCDIRRILRRARKVAGPPPVSVFIALLTQLLEALDYAHLRTDQNGEPLGLVHRDVSPSNLIVTASGHLKVIDFGIAKAQSSYLKTQTGRIKGKLAYMAPEAIRGQELDARSDLFSVGIIAHELLTARPLFATKNEYQTLLRVQRSEIPPPSKYNPECPPELDQLVLGALARAPDERWQSAAEFRNALEALRVHLGVSASHREVAAWMEWAFALEAPPTAAQRNLRRSDSFGSVSEVSSDIFTPIDRTTGVTSFTPASASTPVPAPSPAEVVALPEAPDEDAGASLAWGSLDEEEDDVHDTQVSLEDIPDVSTKASVHMSAANPAAGDASARASGERSAASAISAGMVVERGRGPKRGLLMLGLAAGAAACVLMFLLLRGDRTPPAPAAPVPTTATLKFAVEPAGAIIEVQGYEAHQGAPHRLEVDAPGSYRVLIKSDGYVSYVSEVEIEPSEIRTIQVALQAGGSDQAKLAVQSTPVGQQIMLDGELLAERTPVDLEVAPGAHILAIVDDDGNERWTHAFQASANTQYEFHPALATLERPSKHDEHDSGDRARRRARREAAPAAAVAAEPAVAEVRGGAEPGAEDERRRPAIGGIAALATSTSSMLDSVEVAEPPKLPARSSNKPLRVSSREMKRESGSLPMLSADKRDLPERTKALMCVDTGGSVTSVKIYTEMPAEVRHELGQTLKKWRYQPYRKDGEVVPVCFGIIFRTVLR
ncbi:MAG: hypothetical protein Tsb0020_15840 [Haliangiales bacterium]